MRTAAGNIFTTIRTEGALLPADFLQHVAEGNREIEGLSPDSYHLVPGEKLNEAINRSWNRLLGAWTGFKDASEKLGASDLGTGLTRERWLLPLFQELGYGRLQTAKAFEIDNKSYPISHGWQGTPIHLVGCKIDLDRRTSGVVGAARTSPHGLVQEMLNRSEAHLWGFVSNGHRLRILRDNITLTRQAFVEFDLAAMFDGEVYADFVVLWLLCHQSRIEGERLDLCWLEKWSQLAEKRGTRVLEYLRTGVENAINALGSGFLAHPANRELRNKLSSATLNSQDYYRQLLRVVYRILFLFVAEDRGLLFEPKFTVTSRELYSRFYSVGRLRRLAERRAGTQHPDLWRGLTLVFEKLDMGSVELGLPALGSFLWSREATTEITGCELANRDLLKAIHSLAFIVDGRVRRLVDYKNLGSEELGSIYEALLEQHPQLNVDAATFVLSTAVGNERKTTGSYYTPTSLVNCLLDSALDPVLDEACKKPNPEQAILDLKICDPATGSGHFLIAAAHRLAKRLAALRTGDEEPSPAATRTALRDVIGHCLYGVDVNPMAVELCKVSLWMEAVEPGKPLSFLDHRIKVGNSLMGATPALIEKGIPDEAFTALEEDDKAFVAALKRANKTAREQGNMLLFSGEIVWQALARVKDGVVRLEAIDDDTLDDILAKQAEFKVLMTGEDYRDQKLVADAWCAAFTVLKTRETGFRLTEEEFSVILARPRACAESMRARIKAEAEAHSFFHWHLEFPDAFELYEKSALGRTGGFDIVLGNPPWERVNVEARQFFAKARPDIADAITARRRQLVGDLVHENPELFRAFREAQRDAASEIAFFQNSGIYPHLNQARLNTYVLFTELVAAICKGRCGIIVPSGIATDEISRHLFAFLMHSGRLVSLFDFENRQAIFPSVDRRYKFCLLTLRGVGVSSPARFAFFLQDTDEIKHGEKLYSLTVRELELVSPISGLCPTFRTPRDREIVLKLYSRVLPFILNEDWRRSEFLIMFRSDDSSHLYKTIEELQIDEPPESSVPRLEVAGAVFVPIWEAKLLHQFDHRFASFTGVTAVERKKGNAWEVPSTRKEKTWFALPRYWAPLESVHGALGQRRWRYKWLIGYRDITNATNERTAIASCLPEGGAAQPLNLFLPESALHGCIWLAAMNSFVVDYVARQRIGGVHLNITTCRQLPIIGPEALGEEWRSFIGTRVVELVFTSPALELFAQDCSWFGAPFTWDEARRFNLRCELDAALFNLYGLSYEEAAYILDTFHSVRTKDEEQHGSYRTKERILEIYKAMAKDIRAAKP